MEAPRFSQDVRPLTDLKVKTSAVIEQVCRNKRPVLLTRRGRGLAVLLDLEEYERLIDRATFIEAVEAGRQAMLAGDLHPHEEAKAILDDFGKTVRCHV